eukprot:scaffold11095_cov19-Tisochrysis_lutea.AAC.1
MLGERWVGSPCNAWLKVGGEFQRVKANAVFLPLLSRCGWREQMAGGSVSHDLPQSDALSHAMQESAKDASRAPCVPVSPQWMFQWTLRRGIHCRWYHTSPAATPASLTHEGWGIAGRLSVPRSTHPLQGAAGKYAPGRDH